MAHGLDFEADDRFALYTNRASCHCQYTANIHFIRKVSQVRLRGARDVRTPLKTAERGFVQRASLRVILYPSPQTSTYEVHACDSI